MEGVGSWDTLACCHSGKPLGKPPEETDSWSVTGTVVLCGKLNDLCLIQTCDWSQQLHSFFLCLPNISGIRNFSPSIESRNINLFDKICVIFI